MLWFSQCILAYIYGASGLALASQPVIVLVAIGARYAIDYPEAFVRLVGLIQLLGAVGIILPALIRIMPGLTVAAALGLSVMQLVAMVFLAMRGELGASAPTNLLLLFLSVFVLWGRIAASPISPRRSPHALLNRGRQQATSLDHEKATEAGGR